MSASNNADPHRIDRPEQFSALTGDQTVAAILRLAMEVSVLRERLKTHEALLDKHGLLSSTEVDHYQAEEQDKQARASARAELIEKLIEDLAR